MNTISAKLIEWSCLSAKEQAMVRRISISQEQVEFAGTIESAIMLCESNNQQEVVGLAILSGAVPVGFLLLKRGSKAPQWIPRNSVAIAALRIDAKHQGFGYGTQALKLVPEWVEKAWPTAENLVLSVDEENESAIKSYKKAGWTDDGVRIQGRIGWERHMTLPLTNA